MIALLFVPIPFGLIAWLTVGALDAQEAWDWRWDEPAPCDCLICQFERELAP